MKLKPIHNHVVIQPIEETEKRYGNIIVADINKDLPKIGKVVAVGVGTYTQNGTLIPIQVNIGDKVAFPAFGGVKFNVNNEEFIILKDPDILTVIEDNE
jgi:chaperonin GroES